MNASWLERAACRGADTNLWFPPKGHSAADAQKVCDGCPVRAECLAYALQFHIYDGILGGLRAQERKDIRRASGTTMQCAGCDKSFVAFSAHRRFCTTACRLKAKSVRLAVAHRIGTSEYKERARAQRTP